MQNLPAQNPIHRAIRRPQLEQATGLKRTSIYNKLNPKSPQYDPTFPRPINLSSRTIAWVESEVQAWIDSRIAASRAVQGGN
ncbi:helix-turn-helix transcriptional regulator [Crenothrix sp.]|uniref:helix-turn-helix transcriptional regulator n=1 Tax=Crenothrix sp. TaxID=3100433 RepID=UPI00374DDEE4